MASKVLCSDSMFGLGQNIINEIAQVFERHPAIEQVFIFGSRAKGNYTTGSDIDLAIMNTLPSEELDKIRLEIDELELLYGTDILLYENKKGTPIGDHIDRVGKVFYQRKGI